MQEHILNKYGFKKISLKEAAKAETVEDGQDDPNAANSIDVSVIQPQDHRNPQLVFKLSRAILTKMNWEITDRVTLLSNPVNKTVALVKTDKKDKNSFAISTQGATIAVAKQSKRGGVVKIGWREELCEAIAAKGTFKTTMEIFNDALIVQLPNDIFQATQVD